MEGLPLRAHKPSPMALLSHASCQLCKEDAGTVSESFFKGSGAMGLGA